MNKLMFLTRKNIIVDFELVGSKKSYWVQCDTDLVAPPEQVADDTGLNSTIAKESEMVVKNWKFFNQKYHKDFKNLVKYIVWLRKNYWRGRSKVTLEGTVSDHIYEM